jgi:hypothetical protein
MEVKILDRSQIDNYIENSIREFAFNNHNIYKQDLRPAGVIMNHRTAFDILKTKPDEYSFMPGVVQVQPNGSIKIKGLQVIRTSDVDENTLIFF